MFFSSCYVFRFMLCSIHFRLCFSVHVMFNSFSICVCEFSGSGAQGFLKFLKSTTVRVIQVFEVNDNQSF